ncbi:unnamed protein product [Cylindrotheca closterium]|uniref:Uncharacterized protein n=1 Tax=Cylindrotheca closterium TaxID=2856 RepID=A0AAD2CL07_9STRA|nr:unnamed protein product [Cylindrotheca closterium]
MTAAQTSTAGTSGGNDQPRRGAANNAGRNDNKKRKEIFKGDIEEMGGAVLQFPDERNRGSAAQYERFYMALKDYIGREVSVGAAKLWAKTYVKEMDPSWEPPVPIEPTTNKNDVKALLLYESEKAAYVKHIGATWPAAKLEIWSTIMAQCSPKLRAHLQQLPFYDKAESTHDCIALLENANVLCGGGNLLAFQPQARAEALLDLVQYKQLNGTLDDYYNDFKARYATFSSLGGDLTTKEDTWTTANGTKASTNQALLVCLFLANADRKRFGDCVTDLRNDASSKLVRYPETLADAYTMLGEYVRKHKKNSNNNNSDELNAYLEIDHSRPENEICLTSTKYEWLIDLAWILLDTASTVTIFCNALYLRGMRQARHPTTIHTSGGTITATLEGYLPFLRKWVAFHPDCLANIISFRDLLDAHHVTLNSRQSRSFTAT